jgi:hypothetical protein
METKADPYMMLTDEIRSLVEAQEERHRERTAKLRAAIEERDALREELKRAVRALEDAHGQTKRAIEMAQNGMDMAERALEVNRSMLALEAQRRSHAGG